MRQVLALPLLLFLALPAAAQVSGPAPNCCVEDTLAQANCQCGRCECCRAIRPPWYFRTEGVFLTRDVDGARALATFGPDPAKVVLSTTEFDRPFRGGAKLLVGHTFGDSPYGIEFSSFSVSEWLDEMALRDTTQPNGFPGGVGFLYSPFTDFATVQGFEPYHLVTVREISDLDSQEMNIRHVLPMPTRCLTVSWLLGVRHIGIHEQFNYAGYSGLLPLPQMPQLPSLGLQTNTGNRMWGPQIGGLFEFYAQHCCWVNFEIKGALLGNSAYQETSGFLANEAPLQGLGRREKNTTAFAADFDLTLVYHPTRWLTARIGYQALWVGGLALASDNFNIPDQRLVYGPSPPPIHVDGQVLYHGPHVGLEVHW